uniref:Uncharacterized protein n=1 Tax=Romanomermis culicivorax TaxID=13658 RepID=A0A915L2E1_ROMCU
MIYGLPYEWKWETTWAAGITLGGPYYSRMSSIFVYVFRNITAPKRRYSVAQYSLYAEGNALY